MNGALVQLDNAELAQLGRYEERISQGLASFIEVGEALSAIRDKRLYRATHGTFEDYCREKWGMTDRRARQIMVAAEIGTMVPVLTTERQARELAKVEPARRQEVVEAAVAATGGKLTAAAINEAAKPMSPIGDTEPEETEEDRMRAASWATAHAQTAIENLRKISRKDPNRAEALEMVVSWINKNK